MPVKKAIRNLCAQSAAINSRKSISSSSRFEFCDILLTVYDPVVVYKILLAYTRKERSDKNYIKTKASPKFNLETHFFSTLL